MEPRGDATKPVDGRYHLTSCLGRGPASERWAATDEVLAREVAVEFLDTTAAADPSVVDAFRQAANTAARLAHPGIMAVYDTGTDRGIPYLVSELPRGRNLRQVLDQFGPVSAFRAVTIGYQVAGVLAVAHQAGITHGGLSLDAVTVSDDDRVKVGGFGPGAALPHRDLGHGSPPGSRAGDVSDAAALIYELLCGRAPGSDATPPRLVRAGIPPALDRLIMAALPGGPVSTAVELRDALGDIDILDDAAAAVIRDPTPPVAIRPVARGHRTNRAGATAVVVLVLAAVAAVIMAMSGGGGSRSLKPGPAGAATGGGHATPTPVGVGTVTAFDPPPKGDGLEDDSKLRFLHDGNPATSWSTDEYASRQFGGIKAGVGVSLTLDHRSVLRSMDVAAPSGNWSADVYVADQPASTLNAWGRPVAHFTVSGATTTVDLHSATGSSVLVWITDLGDQNRNSTTSFHYRADIAELSFHE